MLVFIVLLEFCLLGVLAYIVKCLLKDMQTMWTCLTTITDILSAVSIKLREHDDSVADIKAIPLSEKTIEFMMKYGGPGKMKPHEDEVE